MSTVLVVLEVIERVSRKTLVAPIEQTVTKRYDEEPDYDQLDRAKRAYLLALEKRIQFEPSFRKMLAGIDWCIDGVVV